MIYIKNLLEILKKLPEDLYVFLENSSLFLQSISPKLLMIDPKIYETINAYKEVKDYRGLWLRKRVESLSILKIYGDSKAILETLMRRLILSGYQCKISIDTTTNLFSKNEIERKILLKATATPIKVNKLIKKLNKLISSGVSSSSEFITLGYLSNDKGRKEIFTSYINGIGYNKRDIILNDQIIPKGKAVIINTDYLRVHDTRFTDMIRTSICDFSIFMGCDRKPLVKYNKFTLNNV